MIQGTILKNGKLRLILTGSDDMDLQALKQLNGSRVTFVEDNLKLFDKSLSGALILEPDDAKKLSNVPTDSPNAQDLGNPRTGLEYNA